MAGIKLTPAERFWNKVNVLGPDDCWPWLGGRNEDGYGITGPFGHQTGAHRFAWSLANGPIPEGMCVCHRCDVPQCCNVRHLWLGTRAENNADREMKGRSADVRGEKHPSVKLTTADVLAIRQSAELQKTLAARFGIKQANVSRIRRRETWKHVA